MNKYSDNHLEYKYSDFYINLKKLLKNFRKYHTYQLILEIIIFIGYLSAIVLIEASSRSSLPFLLFLPLFFSMGNLLLYFRKKDYITNAFGILLNVATIISMSFVNADALHGTLIIIILSIIVHIIRFRHIYCEEVASQLYGYPDFNGFFIENEASTNSSLVELIEEQYKETTANKHIQAELKYLYLSKKEKILPVASAIVIALGIAFSYSNSVCLSKINNAKEFSIYTYDKTSHYIKGEISIIPAHIGVYSTSFEDYNDYVAIYNTEAFVIRTSNAIDYEFNMIYGYYNNKFLGYDVPDSLPPPASFVGRYIPLKDKDRYHTEKNDLNHALTAVQKQSDINTEEININDKGYIEILDISAIQSKRNIGFLLIFIGFAIYGISLVFKKK